MHDFDERQRRLEQAFTRGLREQTIVFFLCWSVALAAIIGLYFRI